MHDAKKVSKLSMDDKTFSKGTGLRDSVYLWLWGVCIV